MKKYIWFLVISMQVVNIRSEEWPGFKVVYGSREDTLQAWINSMLYNQPTTVEDAVEVGFSPVDPHGTSCKGQWLGTRYGKASDPSLILLFDASGSLAGIQSVLLESSLDAAGKSSVKSNSFYQHGDFFGSSAYFTTSYFKTPESICRQSSAPRQQAIGDRLIFQNGPTPDKILAAPLNEAEADADAGWTKGQCYLNLGTVYTSSGSTCSRSPIQLFFDKGNLHGFGWIHYARPDGTKYTSLKAKDWMPDHLRSCAKLQHISTMNVFFSVYPTAAICPTSPQLLALEELTTKLLKTVPTKGSSKPIVGPKQNQKVCIVGAGPSGMHMAASLRKNGFKNLVMFEATNRVGGKNEDLNYNGHTHKYMLMNTAYFANVIPLAQEYGTGEVVEINPVNAWAPDQHNQATIPLTFEEYMTEAVMNATGCSREEVVPRLMKDTLKFDTVRKEMFGDFPGSVSNRPSAETMHRMRGTALEFLIREGLESYIPVFKVHFTFYGYGLLNETAAYYPLMVLGGVSGLYGVDKLLGINRSPAMQGFSLKHGFEQIWKNIQAKEQFDIRFNTRINSVERQKSGVKLGWWAPADGIGGFTDPMVDSESEDCDFLIWTAPGSALVHSLKDQTEHEHRMYTSLQHAVKTVAYINAINDKRNGPMCVEQAAMDGDDLDGVLYEISTDGWDYPGITNRTIEEAWNRNTTNRVTRIAGVVRHTASNEMDSQRKMREMYEARGGTDIEFLRTLQWHYFPRWSPENIEKGYIWDVLESQGEGNMWVAGGSFCFESVMSVVEYNLLLLRLSGIQTSQKIVSPY